MKASPQHLGFGVGRGPRHFGSAALEAGRRHAFRLPRRYCRPTHQARTGLGSPSGPGGRGRRKYTPRTRRCSGADAVAAAVERRAPAGRRVSRLEAHGDDVGSRTPSFVYVDVRRRHPAGASHRRDNARPLCTPLLVVRADPAASRRRRLGGRTGRRANGALAPSTARRRTTPWRAAATAERRRENRKTHGRRLSH